MPNSYIRLAANQYIRIFPRHIGKQVERKYHAAIGAVLKWNDAPVCRVELHGGEDVFDLGDGVEGYWAGGGREGGEGGLGGD